MKPFTSIISFLSFQVFLVVLFLFRYSAPAFSQNLAPNPDFEYYTDCPYVWDDDGPMSCAPWISYYSANYFNACNPGPVGVPDNFRGFQPAHSGQAYVGGYQRDSREFIYAQLLEPLVAGQCYEVSFYASCSNEGCGINHLGAWFSADEPAVPPYGEHPQLDGGGQFFSDTLNWFQISGTFIAVGGEQWITLGNFYSNLNTQYDPTCSNAPTFAYYYFDDVSVVATTTYPITVDLGGPYEVCNYLELDAGYPGANYLWNTGSINQVLPVITSGNYSVVVSFPGCIGGIGTADVTILGFPAVNLGPDVTICPGETYVIDLDGTLGDYQWQDGTTNPNYLISSTGNYSVSFDDGCDVSWDEIEVTVLDPPSFSLGVDTLLCVGDQFSIVMDPNMGDFNWQDNSSNFFYFIDEPGTYAVTVTNQCGEAEDEIEVSPLSPPDFDLGPDSALVCTGFSLNVAFDPSMGDYVWQDGSTLPFYSMDTTGLYSLTVTNVCGSLSDNINITEIYPPEIDLGGTALLCPEETLLLDAGYAFSEYNWQNGSGDPQFLVTSGGEYSVTVTNLCGSAMDNILVEEATDIVPPDLGPDTSICSGGSFLLEVNQQNAVIQWSNGSTNQSLLVTTSDVYSVTVSSICESYSDTINITINTNGPDVTLPADFALCQGQNAIIDASISNVAYQWNDGSQLSQITVSSPGTYSLTISNPCGTDHDSITIFDGGPAPSVSLGTDTSMCAGGSILLSPLFSNVNSWLWPDGSDTTFFTALSPGPVFVQASNSCGVVYDTVLINQLQPVPDLDLGNDISMCPGETIAFVISIPNVNILWFDGSTNNSIIVSGNQAVVATISNACGLSSDTLNVDLLPDVSTFSLGPDQTICPGESITLEPGIPDAQYSWQDGSTDSVYHITQADTIILTVTNTCGSTSDTLAVVESTDGPQVDLGPDQHACEGQTITIPAGLSGVQYLWQDGSTDDQFIASSSGTIVLIVQNACGTDTDTIQVDISGNAPMPDLGTDTTLCIGSTLTLESNADASTSVQWQDGTSNSTYMVSATGLYYLTVSNECGTASDSVQVYISGTAPVVSLGPDTSLCIGTALTLFSNSDPLTSISWQDGSTTPEYLVLSSGMYILSASNNCGIVSDSILVNFNDLPPDPELGPDTILCDGNFLALFSNADVNTTSAWQDGSITSPYLVTQPGIYSLTQSNHCGEKSDTIHVAYQSPPIDVNLGPDTLLCLGKTLLLTAPASPDEVTWQDGSHAQSFLVHQAGDYSLQLRNACGLAYDDIKIAYDDRLIQAPIMDFPEKLCSGEELILDLTQGFEVDYEWSTGATSSSITVTTPGDYFFTITSFCQENIDAFIVELSGDCDTASFFIPNVISPNDDNINDVFTVNTSSGMQIISLDGSIFDRWGNLVFSSNENPFKWNGKFKDENINPGVYVYALNITYILNGREISKSFTGDVTVIK